jgi:hypothetical protein
MKFKAVAKKEQHLKFYLNVIAGAAPCHAQPSLSLAGFEEW